MTREFGLSENVVAFGPFRLFQAERLLEKSGVPIHIGSRAFDILNVLVDHATETVSKNELVERVWPDVTVEEVALRVHITRLRKILGDGANGARYITTVPGRGYCFTCPVIHMTSSTRPREETGPTNIPRSLPPRPSGMIGRDELIAALSRSFLDRRLLSIVGPGGIGKTTVAVAVANDLLSAFGGAIHFIDLSPLRDPRLMLNLVARSFGLSVRTENLLPTLIAYLHKRRVLIVFDSCEHVVAEVAALIQHLLRQTMEVFVLATSREALGIEGEHIHRLEPLRTPGCGLRICATDALSFSAIRLFVERVVAATNEFLLDDTNALLIAEVCRRLDGIPLAIELVAGSVYAYGISGVAAFLDDRLQLSIRGQRTALPRHQTLSATLDWSYELLREDERRTLRCLSVFVGFFSLEEAKIVCTRPDDDDFGTIEAVANLVAKSLVSTEFQISSARYRLLDTTQAYAHGRLVESGEADAIAHRHANYYRGLLEKAEERSSEQSSSEGLAAQAIHIDNVRVAVSWAFASSRNREVGVALVAAAVPLMLELSLMTECRAWTEQAIGALSEIDRGTRRELMLQTAYGVSLIATKGNGSDVLAAFNRALAIAERINDVRFQVRLYEVLHVTHLRTRNLDDAFTTARRAEAVARTLTEAEAVAAANCMMGLSYHFSGEHAVARGHLELAANSQPAALLVTARRFGVNFRINALCALARIQWLQGHCDAAFRSARDVVSEGQVGGNMMSYATALALTVPVHLWRGDNAIAQEIINLLMDLARRHGFGPTLAHALGWQGALAATNGKAVEGIQLLRTCIRSLQDINYQITVSVFRGFCAVALAANDEIGSALSAIDLAIDETARAGDFAYMPELLRTKGSILTMSGDVQAGEAALLQALAEARRQSALSWELRVACDLAKNWRQQSRVDEALALLSPIYDRFTEGFDTIDLRTAAQLLEELGAGSPGPAAH